MRKLILSVFAIAAISFTSCTEKKSQDETSVASESNSKNSKKEDKAVEIPMHGTSENSSSSTNQRFEMNKDMKQMIQNEKSKE